MILICVRSRPFRQKSSCTQTFVTIYSSRRILHRRNMRVSDSPGLSSDDFDSQRRYYQTHPPACLFAFDVKPIEGKGGETLESGWMMRCKCGLSDFRGRMYSTINPSWSKTEPVLVSPITLTCTSCSDEGVVFDSNKDGYDPATSGIGHSIYGPKQDGANQITFACRKCGNQSLKYFSIFRYTDDLYMDDFSKFRGIEQNLFENFSLIYRCDGCKTAEMACDFECA